MSQTDPFTGPTETRYGDPASRTSRALLVCGVIAGPMYVVVSLIQALTREGFDLTRHSAGIRASGGPRWLQVLNLVLTGTMTRRGRGRAAPRAAGSAWRHLETSVSTASIDNLAAGGTR